MNKLALFKKEKKEKVASFIQGKIIPTEKIVTLFEELIAPNDRVILEGDNQKQATFLAKSLCKVDPEKVHGLKMVIPSVSESTHLDLFELGIAETLDFSFAGSQSLRIANMIENQQVKVGSINTYIELYAQLFVDLIPNICLVAADKADKWGNLYTGSNTEETPTLVEACAFKDGIVIVQVNSIEETLPRVDIPGDWIDYIVVADEPYDIKPIFTRDPAKINDMQILMAMMILKGIYAKHQVTSLNHGIGYNTVAIELILPTYGEQLGLKGKICNNWILNPQPTLIPAIESGWVDNVYCFGGEKGMEEYVRSRPDVFPTGPDGSLRSNRTLAQLAGLYGIDLFVGSTLQMDYYGNSSTVTNGRLSGFGGAPNMGHNSNGRRHATPAWMSLSHQDDKVPRGRKLVVQVFESSTKKGNESVIVEELDAVNIAKQIGLPVAPIMIYGDDVTHVVTEQGIAYLYLCSSLEERKLALAAIAGNSPLADQITMDETLNLRKKGIVAYPEDLDINPSEANRSLLAAKNMDELVQWSNGLYTPPESFTSK